MRSILDPLFRYTSSQTNIRKTLAHVRNEARVDARSSPRNEVVFGRVALTPVQRRRVARS
jgi:hypothetical protein